MNYKNYQLSADFSCITFAGLKQIYNDYKQKLGPDFNTHQLCTELKKTGLHLAKQYQQFTLIPPAVTLGTHKFSTEEVVIGNYLAITYSWSTPFQHVLKVVCMKLAYQQITPSEIDKFPIWMDIVFVNQNAKDLVKELAKLPGIYQQCRFHVVVGYSSFTRGWCMYEIGLADFRRSHREQAAGEPEHYPHRDKFYIKQTTLWDKQSVGKLVNGLNAASHTNVFPIPGEEEYTAKTEDLINRKFSKTPDKSLPMPFSLKTANFSVETDRDFVQAAIHKLFEEQADDEAEFSAFGRDFVRELSHGEGNVGFKMHFALLRLWHNAPKATAEYWQHMKSPFSSAEANIIAFGQKSPIMGAPDMLASTPVQQ